MIKWITEDYDTINPSDYNEEELIGLEINDSVFEDEYGDGDIPIFDTILSDLKIKDLPFFLSILPTETVCPDFHFQKLMITFYRTAEGMEVLYYIPKDSDTKDFELKKLEAHLNFEEVSDEGEVYIGTLFYDDSNLNLGNLMRDLEIYFTLYKTEEEFTKLKVIPALKKIGLKNVTYNHGIDEYGKDIIYEYTDIFGNNCYGAAQVKLGNISGNAKNNVLELSSQINLAFSMPLNSLNFNSKDIKISELLIICSGSFTKNAEQIILNNINSSYTNIKWIDGEKIEQFLLNSY